MDSLESDLPLRHVEQRLQRAGKSQHYLPPEVASRLPTDARTMYDMLLADHAIPLYEYRGCLGCGRLRRCDLQDSSTCSCGLAWGTTPTARVFLFSIVDWLVAIFKVPILAKAMAYTASAPAAVGADAPMLDIQDTAWYDRVVRKHPILSKDPRYAQIVLYLDGMLKSATDQTSGTVKVFQVKLLNFPPHFRNTQLCTLPVCVYYTSRFKDRSLDNLRGVHDVLADQIAYLRHVGVSCTDAYRGGAFRLRGDLVELLMDSRGVRELTGRGEPGRKHGASLGNDLRGYTVMDYTRPQRPDGSYPRMSKAVYVSNWTELPLHSRARRSAASSLNPRDLLTSGENVPEGPWSIDTPPGDRKSDSELRQAFALLHGLDEEPDEALRKKRVLAAESYGVLDPSPYVEKTGVLVDAAEKYESMHVTSNIAKLVRDVQMGQGVLGTTQDRVYLLWDMRTGGRFLDARRLIDVPLTPEEQLRLQGEHMHVGVCDGTKNEMREALMYPFTEDEAMLAWRRGEAVLQHELCHPGLKSAAVLLFYRPATSTRGLQFLKADDCAKAMSPLGAYLMAGLACRPFTVGGFSSTYETVYLQMVRAVNEVNRKGQTPSEAAAALQQVIEAVTDFYIALPTFEQKHTLHQLIEVAREAPVYLHAVFDGERRMRKVRALDVNAAVLAPTVMFSFQRITAWQLRESIQISPSGEQPDREKTSSLTAALMTRLSERVEGELPSGVQLVQPPAEWYTPGVTAVAFPRKGVHLQDGASSTKDIHLTASLIQFYLTDDKWHPVMAPKLHALVGRLLGSSPQGHSLVNPLHAHGPEAKVAAWRALRAACDALEKENESLLHINHSIHVYQRCDIGSLSLRAARLDDVTSTKTVGSYFLARVDGEGGWWYEVGRCQRLFKHLPPGCTAIDDAVGFVQASWLIPVIPRLTPRSKLPIVVLDNDPNRYLCDDDAQDGLMTGIWPLANVASEAVCVLPLDSMHDVPADARLECKSAAMPRGLLTPYIRGDGNPGAVKPGEGVAEGRFMLGAVITKHFHVTCLLPLASSSERFDRRLKLISTKA